MEKSLSPELYLNIFRHLSPTDIREAVSLVSHRWYRLVQEFHLVENRVMLSTPVNYFVEKISKDFKRFPEFRYKIKAITIKDYCGKEKINKYNEREWQDKYEGADKLCSLVELCPHVEELKIQLEGYYYRSSVFQEIVHMKEGLITKIKSLEVDSTDSVSDRSFRFYKKTITDLTKLIKYTFPNLQQLVFTSPIFFFEELVFVHCDDLNFSMACYFIKKIKIVSLSFLMTKICLENLISGQLTNLEDLNLCVKLISCLDKKNADIDTNDVVFEKLRDFCVTTLKSYDISLVNRSRYLLFSIDNCATE